MLQDRLQHLDGMLPQLGIAAFQGAQERRDRGQVLLHQLGGGLRLLVRLELVAEPLRSSRMIWRISAIVSGSMPVNGSSNRISVGSVTRQRAISRRRFSPPDRRADTFLRTLFSPNRWIAASIRSFRSVRFGARPREP